RCPADPRAQVVAARAHSVSTTRPRSGGASLRSLGGHAAARVRARLWQFGVVGYRRPSIERDPIELASGDRDSFAHDEMHSAGTHDQARLDEGIAVEHDEIG